MSVIRRSACLTYVLALAAGPIFARAQAVSTPASADAVVARTPSGHVTEADVDRWWSRQDAGSYYRVQRDLYDGRRRALDELIDRRLIEAVAARRGVSVEQLLELELPARTRPITEAEMDEFLDRAEPPAGVSVEEVTAAVRTLLERRSRSESQQHYAEELRRAAGDRLQVMLAPVRQQIPVAPANPAQGATDAPVQIVVFSDFQCPFCKRLEPVLERLRATFGDRARLVWKHFPLTMHADAELAAEAAQCAHDQRRFWEYHDALFRNQAALGKDDLRRVAEQVSLDATDFDRCLDTHRNRAIVEADMREGTAAGVSATPTIFINGRALVGALEFETYEAMVTAELAQGAAAVPPGGP